MALNFKWIQGKNSSQWEQITTASPFHLAKQKNGWCNWLTLYPRAVKAHETVEKTCNSSNSGGGWGWEGEKEKKGSWGKRKGLKGQKNCMGNKDIASKAERVAQETSMRGHPKGLRQDGHIL